MSFRCFSNLTVSPICCLPTVQSDLMCQNRFARTSANIERSLSFSSSWNLTANLTVLKSHSVETPSALYYFGFQARWKLLRTMNTTTIFIYIYRPEGFHDHHSFVIRLIWIQYGFRERKSTQHALIDFDKITKAIEELI